MDLGAALSGARSSGTTNRNRIRKNVRNFIIWAAVVVIVMSVTRWGYHLATSYSGPSSGSTTASVVYKEQRCSNRAKVDVLPAYPIQVRDADNCIFHFGVVGGKAELSGPSGTIIIGPGEEVTVPTSFTIRMARAFSGKPSISRTSCDLEKNSGYDGQNCI